MISCMPEDHVMEEEEFSPEFSGTQEGLMQKQGTADLNISQT